MPDYRLYCFAQSGNSYKVALMLALCGLDWEPATVDFFHGATRDPEWRAEVNAMGEAPVLDHAGKRLAQSGVILTYLSRRTGQFGPENEDEELEILRWFLFDNHKFTSYFATHRFMFSLAGKPADPAVLGFLRSRIDGALAIVEKHLADRPFIVGGRPTIADFSLAGYMFYPIAETGYDLAASHPNIHAWRERIAALPGWKPPYDLMPAAPPAT
ncbi:glutathione S-transferase family protein [Phreatobacter stygius]|uniref:Glutathione S-transferase n=1 Tax=Phreatobacter stygius TaxID=1940610 RepID=A0A4D7BM31_9HYPH|nr:glutathione S-transferase [Phreatobacter stygius]QCI68752.1 glutathione S-transferase [Phreatobacter stygius]